MYLQVYNLLRPSREYIREIEKKFFYYSRPGHFKREQQYHLYTVKYIIVLYYPIYILIIYVLVSTALQYIQYSSTSTS